MPIAENKLAKLIFDQFEATLYSSNFLEIESLKKVRLELFCELANKVQFKAFDHWVEGDTVVRGTRDGNGTYQSYAIFNRNGLNSMYLLTLDTEYLIKNSVVVLSPKEYAALLGKNLHEALQGFINNKK